MSSKRRYDAHSRSSNDSDDNQNQEVTFSRKSNVSDKRHHRSKITEKNDSERQHRRKNIDGHSIENRKRYHDKHAKQQIEESDDINKSQKYKQKNVSDSSKIHAEKYTRHENEDSAGHSIENSKRYHDKHAKQQIEESDDINQSKKYKQKNVSDSSKNHAEKYTRHENQDIDVLREGNYYSKKDSRRGTEHSRRNNPCKSSRLPETEQNYRRSNSSEDEGIHSRDKEKRYSGKKGTSNEDMTSGSRSIVQRSNSPEDEGICSRDKEKRYSDKKGTSNEDMTSGSRSIHRRSNSSEDEGIHSRDKERSYSGRKRTSNVEHMTSDSPDRRNINSEEDPSFQRMKESDSRMQYSSEDESDDGKNMSVKRKLHSVISARKDCEKDNKSKETVRSFESDQLELYSDGEIQISSDENEKRSHREKRKRYDIPNESSWDKEEYFTKRRNNLNDNRHGNFEMEDKRSRRDDERYRNKTDDRNRHISDEDMDYGDGFRGRTKQSERHNKNDVRGRTDRDAVEREDQNAAPEVRKDEPQSKRVQIQTVNLKTGGAYIPPARLKMMQEQIKDKGSLEFQRIAWEALKKSIVGMTNKVNISNISEIVIELFKENIIRGRGVLSRAVMQAQAASPSFTRVYASLVAILNTKFPAIGELIVKRLILQYRRGFRRNDKIACLSACRFIAHLFNQEVVHEILILEIVTHLLETPTEDSVETSIALLKECGAKLTQLTKAGMQAITSRLRAVHHEAKLEDRVRYMMDVFFAVVKSNFKDFDSIVPELDLVEEGDKYTHLINLDDDVDGQDILNVFKFDPEYEETEEKYKSVVKEILGDDSGSEDEDEDSDEDEEGGEGAEKKPEEGQQILDMTETNIVCLRRKIYLTIQSSLDFEECAHKLLKLELKPGQIVEMCYMILDCCAQQRTYEKFFGLLAQRFCQINKVYAEPFTEIFENSYKTIHRLETNKLRNVANFFAHLLYTDAISWMVLSIIRLNEEDTTSSSRVFIKILFQELCEYMGLPKLNARIQDATFQEAFDGLFPRDHPHNTRFAINFFTSIGLGGLTDELREHLKNAPKKQLIPEVNVDMPNESPASESDSESESEKRKKKSKKHKKRKK